MLDKYINLKKLPQYIQMMIQWIVIERSINLHWGLPSSLARSNSINVQLRLLHFHGIQVKAVAGTKPEASYWMLHWFSLTTQYFISHAPKWKSPMNSINISNIQWKGIENYWSSLNSGDPPWLDPTPWMFNKSHLIFIENKLRQLLRPNKKLAIECRIDFTDK